MTRRQLDELISRHLSEEPDAQSEAALRQWADDSVANREFLNLIDNDNALEDEIQKYKQIDPAQGYSKFLGARRAKRKRSTTYYMLVGAAAAAFALAYLKIDIWAPKLVPATKHSQYVTPLSAQNVLPGSNKAILTLANGKAITLDSTGPARLQNEPGLAGILVKKQGIEYQQAPNPAEKPLTYNILEVPKKGYYQVLLADGTKVWVNSMSKLRFPVAFNNKERRIYLSGEGYFEIAKDPSRPFIVQTNRSAVQVLGTSFNIKEYADEAVIQATVLEGAISVKTTNGAKIVTPNQQLQLDSTGRYVSLMSVAAADIVSWKDGFFYFGQGATVQTVIRQIARWYDIEVAFPVSMPVQQFSGKIDRTLNLQDIMKYLEKNQIHCYLDGRKLTILPS